jgi:CheY-like chemotaxis protein/anti-sigma regulatory factor (Ser/Thr protein kinase)
VADVLNWLVQNYSPLTLEKQIGLRLYFPVQESLVVRTDIGLLKSILMNLVSNAIKFTSKGGILISARQRGKEVLFQVWDTGIGIGDENISYIFDEFYQINNLQRDRTRGLGLGLSIAQRAIALLGGEITCRSKVGRGSVFEFCLPMDKSSSEMMQQIAPVISHENAINSSFAPGKRFVVVEDDALVAQAMINLLEGMGGEVSRFHSAEDALCHANIKCADYFISDYMLGGALDGIQFLNTLREELGKPIKAVLITGDTSASILHNAENFDWPRLHKPVNASSLISALDMQEQ